MEQGREGKTETGRENTVYVAPRVQGQIRGQGHFKSVSGVNHISLRTVVRYQIDTLFEGEVLSK